MNQQEAVQSAVDDVMASLPRRKGMDQQALETYLTLKAANPHLPDPMHIPAETDLELTWGAHRMPTLTLSVTVDLPQGFIEGLPGAKP